MRMNRRGNYSMMFAVGFPALLGFAAIAIDTARIQQAQQELEQGAQAIAHAALVSIRDGDSKAYAKNKAKRTGKRNFIAGDKVKIRNRHIKFGFWDFDTATWRNSSVGYNAVKVDLAMDDTSDTLMDPLDMMLTPIMGVSYVNLQANQSTIAAFQTRDIMLVVDTTGSFIGEMPLARQAALTLLTEMHDRYIPGDTIGLATFVGDGKVVTSLADSYTQFSSIYGAWDGSSNPAPHAGCTRNSTPGSWDCTGVQWEIDCFWIWCWTDWDTTNYTVDYGLTWCDTRNDPSSTGGSVFFNYAMGGNDHLAPDMLSCGAGGGGTNQGAGIEAARDELALNGTASAVQSIVVVSDGAPYPGSWSWLAHFGGPSMGPYDYSTYGPHQADLAWADKTHVFSVSYNDTTNPYYYAIQSAYLQSLVRGIGEFYETPDAADLPVLLARVAETIPVVIVQ